MQSSSAVKNEFLKSLLSNAEAIKDILLKKRWQIWRPSPAKEFVTSDNPLVTFMPVGNGELNPGHGFRVKGVVAAFPLAPNACLAMGVDGPETVVLDVTRTTKVNEVIVRLCDRFVYSRTLSAEIQKTVDQCGGAAKYGESAFLPVGLQVPSLKHHLRTTLGLSPE